MLYLLISSIPSVLVTITLESLSCNSGILSIDDKKSEIDLPHSPANASTFGKSAHAIMRCSIYIKKFKLLYQSSIDYPL